MADNRSGSASPRQAWVSAVFDVTGLADNATFVAPHKLQLLRAFLVVLDEQTDAGGGTVRFDTVVASTRGDGDAGIITVPAANNDSKYIYEDMATRLILDLGDQVVVQTTVDNWGGATNMVAGIVYQEVPEVPGNSAQAVAG